MSPPRNQPPNHPLRCEPVSEDAEEEEDDAGAEEDEPSMRRLYTSKMPCLPRYSSGTGHSPSSDPKPAAHGWPAIMF